MDGRSDESEYGTPAEWGQQLPDSTGGWETGGYAAPVSDPNYPNYPNCETGYYDPNQQSGQYAVPYDTGTYQAQGYGTQGYETQGYQTQGYDTGQYAAPAYDANVYGTNTYDTGSYFAPEVQQYDDLYGHAQGHPQQQPQEGYQAAAPVAWDDPLAPYGNDNYDNYDNSGGYQACQTPVVQEYQEYYDTGTYQAYAEPAYVEPAYVEPAYAEPLWEVPDPSVDVLYEEPVAVIPTPRREPEPVPVAVRAVPSQRGGRRRAPVAEPVGDLSADGTPAKRGRRTLVGAGAAVVTGAVLAGAVVMQIGDEGDKVAAAGQDQANSADTAGRDDQTASRSSNGRPDVSAAVPAPVAAPPAAPTAGPSAIPLPTAGNGGTLTERLSVTFPLDPKLGLGGKFDVIPGNQPAPAPLPGVKTVKTWKYVAQIEQGLQLNGKEFAEFTQQAVNDPRSWASQGHLFERVDDPKKADFVIRLASPETLHKICSPVVGDTSVNNVSCNVYTQSLVMINAYRWAQGSTAYGPDILGYRQMLVSHEVGHRIGKGHIEKCMPGGLAPVMMQQTKTRHEDGKDENRECTANPWVKP